MQESEQRAEPAPVAEAPATSGDSQGMALVAAATALALSACGGGESGSSHSPGGGVAQVPPTPIPPAPSPGPLPSPPRDSIPATRREAARFALQAQFSVSEADMSSLKSIGLLAWLDARYNEPLGETGVAWLNSHGHDAITEEKLYRRRQSGDYMIWNQLIAGPDQMRKRIALALSELFVVSLSGLNFPHPGYVIAAYWDALTANAFGNYRQLLEALTLNAGMGFFLSTRGSARENSAGRQPDENYAREVMQLFTIGLYQLNPDGTHKLDADNKPLDTFSQDDVISLARVFTGYDWDFHSNGGTTTSVAWEQNPVPSTHFASNPMAFDSNRHSNMVVDLFGMKITGTTPGKDALQIALDQLFYHDNAGPFFARQMIQRLVTSNPSPGYIERVATVFGNNGSGVRGDLKAVWTAILTDEEARAMPTSADTLFGKLREPIVRLVQWARTAEVVSDNDEYLIDDLSQMDSQLGQSPLRSPTVFNFFRPGYVPPNTEIADADKQAPEFQLLNESSTAGYINFMQSVTRKGIQDVKPTYATLLPIAHDVAGLLYWLNLQLTANQLSDKTLYDIKIALRRFNITESSAESAKLEMLATACFLILISPEYLVQK